jgi:hypothetical protein
MENAAAISWLDALIDLIFQRLVAAEHVSAAKFATGQRSLSGSRAAVLQGPDSRK